MWLQENISWEQAQMGNESKGKALGVGGVFFRSPDAALGNVKTAGGQVIPEKEEHDFGRFGWFLDPDGNHVELWQPPEKIPVPEQ